MLQIHGPGGTLTADQISARMNDTFAVLRFGPIEFYIDNPEQCDWLIKAAVEAKQLLTPPVRECPKCGTEWADEHGEGCEPAPSGEGGVLFPAGESPAAWSLRCGCEAVSDLVPGQAFFCPLHGDTHVKSDEPANPPHDVTGLLGEDSCLVEDGGYICNAQAGHDGPDHVAYGGEGIECYRWPVSAAPEPTSYDRAIQAAGYFAQPGNTVDDILAEQQAAQ